MLSSGSLVPERRHRAVGKGHATSTLISFDSTIVWIEPFRIALYFGESKKAVFRWALNILELVTLM
jgi:hypothetical protein